MEETDEHQTKPTRPDVGYEHGSIIVTWFRKIVEITLRAALQHVDGLHKGPTARFESFAFVTTRAFEVKYTVGFGALSE